MNYKYHSVLGFIVGLCACGGAPGATGPAGAIGASGMTISSGIQCSKSDSGSGILLLIRYESVIYSTGDRSVNCYIGGASASYTDSAIFKSGQSGATTGACQVGVDLDTASFGFWQFTSQSGVSKVVYNDSGSTSNGYTYTYAASDCTMF